MSAPYVEGLDEYSRHKIFASSQLEAGDYVSALEELEAALLIKQDEPDLYELLALAYDGDRQSAAAYENFLLAGQMYLDSGDTDRAWKMLGRMRSYTPFASDARATQLEKKLRSFQMKQRESAGK